MCSAAAKAPKLKAQQMQTGGAPASTKDTKEAVMPAAVPLATIIVGAPSALPGTQQTQNGAQASMATSSPGLPGRQTAEADQSGPKRAEAD